MAFFDPDYLQFFKELAANNHKDWFDENRKRYAKSVKDPFKAFVEHMIGELSKIDPEVADQEASKCIFRINRDIRFSKDKTPYKTQMSAMVGPAGKKSMAVPGYYMEVGPEFLKLYGGIYGLDTEQLEDVRWYLYDNRKTFDKLISAKAFKSRFSPITGEENKRLKGSLMDKSAEYPMILKKQYYFFTKLDPVNALREDLDSFIIEHYKAALPITKFLRESLRA